MKRFITRVVAVVVLSALVTGQAQAQVKRDKQPPGGLGDLTKPVKSATGATSVPLPKAGSGLDAIEKASRVVKLINDLRAKKGTPTLKTSATLDKIAQRYAAQMATKDRLGELDVLTGRDRIPETSKVFTDWHGQWGVQSGQKDPAAAQVQEWLRKRPDMLSTKVTVIGVGVATSSTGKVYFCYLLAAPESVPKPNIELDKKPPRDLPTRVKGPLAAELVPLANKNSEDLLGMLVITRFNANHNPFFLQVVDIVAEIRNTSSHDMKDVTYSVSTQGSGWEQQKLLIGEPRVKLLKAKESTLVLNSYSWVWNPEIKVRLKLEVRGPGVYSSREFLVPNAK